MTLEDKLQFDILKQFPYRINWNMNSLCNMKCSYCFFPHVSEENPIVLSRTTDEVRMAFDNTGKEWLIFLSGGEPFLYPNFIELCKELTRKHQLQISTNLISDKVKTFADEVDSKNIFIINASIHVLSHNKKTLNRYFENFHYLKEKGFDVIASYVTHPELLKRDRIIRDFKLLKENGIWPAIPLTFNGIHKKKVYPGNYSSKQIKTIYHLAPDKKEILNTLGQMNFSGYMCHAGKNYFFMDKNGNISRCVSIKESHGNLFDGTFSSDSEIKPCTAPYCNDSCNGIISVVKEHHITPP